MRAQARDPTGDQVHAQAQSQAQACAQVKTQLQVERWMEARQGQGPHLRAPQVQR